MKKDTLFLALLAFSLLAATAAAVELENREGMEGEVLWSFAYFGEDDYFFRPSDMEYDKANSLIYVADAGNHRVLVFEKDGRYVRTIGEKGQGPGQFARPTGLCIMSDSRLAVADYDNNRIQIFNPDGEFDRIVNTRELRVADLLVVGEEIYTIPSYGSSGYRLNMQLKNDSQPLVNILDFEGNVVRNLNTDAYPESQPFIRSIKHRVSMALSPDGKIFLPFFAINMVYIFDLAGEKLGEFERTLPFKPLFPQLLQQKTSGGVIQMSAKTDMVHHSTCFGDDGNLYILTYGESYDKLSKKRENPEEMPPFPMQVDVFDPNSHRMLRSIQVDPSVRVFTLLGENRMAYIHEDAEGELVFKGVSIEE